METEDPALHRCGKKIGATVKDPEKFQACMDEADQAIYAAEEREPYHPVYIVAGWIALLLSLAVVVVLTAWAFRLI